MIGRADTFVSLPVIASWDETRSLRGVTLAGGAVEEQHQAPGQIIKIRVGDKESYFALANAPRATPGQLELLVRRGSAVGDLLIDAAVPGAELTATPPFGPGFPAASGRGHDVLLFAVGSGISPMRALVHHIIGARQDFGRVALFYGERSETDFAYAAERDTWIAAGIQVVLCCSQPSADWTGPQGYVQDVARSLSFAAVDAGGAVAYLCGMKGMVSAVRDALGEAGLPVERTYLNY
jgi:NAD(P)H-flavin reductase